MNQLYVECLSGISGDMFVAALLDLGADATVLEQVLHTIPVDGFQTKISKIKKAGLDVCDFDVILDHNHENHDHDMEYLFGKEKECEHHHHHHHHAHEHQNMAKIREIIEHTKMTEYAKELAITIFTILGKAEAKAHGTTLDEVHFHEVGAVDSIVDIIAAAVLLDNLQVEQVIIPVLYEGKGTVNCQHGVLPIPVPAVANIIAAHQLPLHIVDMQAELVTPTGAAIAAAIRTKKSLPERFQIVKIGIGAGKRKYEKPSILRAMLIQEETSDDVQSADKDSICKLETNIDDCTGENLGYVMEQLMKAGAKDVHYIPVFMKKNRPAYELHVICSMEDSNRLEKLIFAETTTIGIRKMKMERSILKRRKETLRTAFGEAEVKICETDGACKIYPEYESVLALCKKTGKTFQEMFQYIEGEAYGKYTE